MKDDFANLRKADEGLKKLDNDLNKIFKPERQVNYKKEQSRPKKLVDKKDIETIKTIAKGTNDTISKVYKYATRNQIPKDYQGVMDMKDRLELEKKHRLEIIEAKKIIQQLQKEKKEEDKAERKRKIKKLVSIIHKITRK